MTRAPLNFENSIFKFLGHLKTRVHRDRRSSSLLKPQVAAAMFPAFPLRRHERSKRDERKKKSSQELVKKSHKNVQQDKPTSKSRVHTHHHHHYLYLVTDPLVKPPKQTRMASIPIDANLIKNGLSSFLKQTEPKSIVRSTEHIRMSKPLIKGGPVDQQISTTFRKLRDEGAQANPFTMAPSPPQVTDSLMAQDNTKLDFDKAIASQIDWFEFNLKPSSPVKLPTLAPSHPPPFYPSLAASCYAADEDSDFNSNFLEELWTSVSSIRERSLLDILPHSLDLDESPIVDRINSHP